MGRGCRVILFKGIRDRRECVRGEFQLRKYIERNKEVGRLKKNVSKCENIAWKMEERGVRETTGWVEEDREHERDGWWDREMKQRQLYFALHHRLATCVMVIKRKHSPNYSMELAMHRRMVNTRRSWGKWVYVEHLTAKGYEKKMWMM